MMLLKAGARIGKSIPLNESTNGTDPEITTERMGTSTSAPTESTMMTNPINTRGPITTQSAKSRQSQKSAASKLLAMSTGVAPMTTP